MPSESETFWYLSDKPVTELDQVDDPNILRTWSQESHYGSDLFLQRYTDPAPFFRGEQQNYKTIWMVLCEILFSLRRPHDPERGFGHGEITNYWWRKHRADEEAYLIYDKGDVKYGYVMYLDIGSAEGFGGPPNTGLQALFNGKQVFRSDVTMIFKAEGPSGGSTEGQAALQLGDIEADESTTPIDIPVFPKWGAKIKEKFHRSEDKNMSNWDKSLDNWQKEFQIALAS